jgi:hypothetical protein
LAYHCWSSDTLAFALLLDNCLYSLYKKSIALLHWFVLLNASLYAANFVSDLY